MPSSSSPPWPSWPTTVTGPMICNSVSSRFARFATNYNPDRSVDHMPKTTPIYWRGTPLRAYGNFRSFEDVGGRQEKLVPEGERLATTDPEVADALYTQRRTYYLERRKAQQAGVVFNVPTAVPLALAAQAHLKDRKARAEVEDQWLEQTQAHLERAVQ